MLLDEKSQIISNSKKYIKSIVSEDGKFSSLFEQEVSRMLDSKSDEYLYTVRESPTVRKTRKLPRYCDLVQPCSTVGKMEEVKYQESAA